MGRLEYDDAGAAFFGIGIGTSFLLPLTLSLLYSSVKTVLGGDDDDAESKARTSLEREKLKKIKREKGIAALMTRKFLMRVAMVVAGWLFIVYLYSNARISDVKPFDPWETLGLEEGSPKKQIKSAYRKLSLQMHPDRNLDKDPDERALLATKFKKVQDAHEILTDEEAYNNYLAKGSVDGSGSMETGVGLPSWLMEKRNHNLVLVVYLLVLVVVTPISVGSWYSNSKLYGDRLILNDSYNIYTYLLEKSILLQHLPEVLALSAEFRKLPLRSAEDEECLEKLSQKMKAQNKMMKAHCPKVAQGLMMQRWPACKRANVLIHVHLNRLHAELTPGLDEDLQFILSKSQMLIEAMSEAVVLSRHSPSIVNMLRFEQYMAQALWVGDSSLQQLPHVTKEASRLLSVGKGGVKTLSKFLEADAEARESLLGRLTKADMLSASQVSDVETAAKVLPRVSLKVTIGVIAHENRDGTLEFEEKACEGDIMTAYLELHREHDLGPAHTPFLPFSMKESWVVLFCKAGEEMVLSQAKLSGSGHVLRERIQFPSKGFVKPGVHKFDFHLTSTAYVDLDVKVTESVRLHPEGTVKPLELHEEDLELDKEPTLFEEAFGKAEVSDDSDFADSDDEGEAEEAAAANEAGEKAAGEDADKPRLTQRKGKGQGAAKEDDDLAASDEEYEMTEAEDGAEGSNKKTK